MRARARTIPLAAILTMVGWLAPAAGTMVRAAGIPAPGFAVSDFATGFVAGSVGPVGVVFDASGRLYVANYPEGAIYRFGPAGGVADSSSRIGTGLGAGAAGLAFTKDGRLYLARQSIGDVVELDPNLGTILRTAASGFHNPTGLATDPQSGDLFLSLAGGGPTVYRLKDFQNSMATVLPYASVDVDGITFAPDGTLYGSGGGAVYRIEGTNSANAGQVTQIAAVPYADGIALVAPAPGSTGVSQLAVNRNDGIITLVNFSVTPATTQDIVSGGTRGDFVAVGPDRCLYATQSTSIEKVTAADASCPFLPTGVLSIPPSVMQATGLEVSGLSGLPLAAPVATFTDTDLNAVPAEFSATVLWGDGPEQPAIVMPTTNTSPVSCAATSPPSRCLLVYGQHTYVTNGNFNLVVKVTKVNNQTATAIGQAHITRSGRATVTVSMFGWDVGAAVSAQRGLMIYVAVLNEFNLGRRPMAEDMSVPYLKITTSLTTKPKRVALSPAAVELDPDGSFIASSRLIEGPSVDSIPGDPSSGLPGILIIAARYRIDLSPNPSGTTSWLEVFQRYQFHQEMAGGTPGFPPCEPSQNAPVSLGPLNCARWKPLLEFRFHPGAGDQLLSINAVLRLHFLPDSRIVRATTLIYDCSSTDNGTSPAGDHCQPPLLSLLALYKGQNPIQNEVVVSAVKNNQTAGYDNLHLTWRDHVGLPFPPPGCPECVHMHWRWGQSIGGDNPVFGFGQPLLSPGRVAPLPNPKTDQSLDVALVSNHVGQEAPMDFRDLVRGLAASGYGSGSNALVDPVVFLSATATNETADVFFGFGGFFGSET